MFALITFPILISKYGLKEVGVIFTVQAIVMILASISNYSFVYYIPTVSKRVSEDKIYIIKLWNLALHIRTYFSVFLSLLISLFVYFFYKEYLLIWLLSLPLLIPKIINPTLFCNALEVNKFVFKIGFYSKLLFLLLVYVSNNSNLVNLLLASSELIAILFYLKRIHHGFYNFQVVSFFEIKRFLSKTFNLFLVNFLLLLKPNAILPAVSYLLGFEFAALFSIAQKVINAIKSTSGIVFVSFFPIYTKEKLSYNFLSVKRLNLALLFSIITVIGFWLLSPYLIYVLNNFKINIPAVRTLQILSLSIPIFFMIIPLFSYILNQKKWNIILCFAIIQLLILIIVLNFLIHQNIIGVAKSLVVSEYVLFLCYVIFVSKRRGFVFLR